EDDEDGEDPPAFLRNMTAELDYVTIDYGLYDLRWWMPRLIAFEGVVRIGPVRMPLMYERSYAEYEIEGLAQPVAVPLAEIQRRDSLRAEEEQLCRGRMTVNVRVGESDPRPDSAASTKCGRWEVVMAGDSNSVLHSELLPEDAFSHDEELLTDADLRQLKDRLEGLGGAATVLAAPELRFSLIDPGMLRYNRIEALSLGTSASADFGRYVVGGNVRIGVADLEPNFELSVQRPGENMSLALTGYRRLNGTEPLRSPFTIGNSLSSLLFGRDDADFYRTLGVELRGEPAGAAGGNYWWRVYGQQERSAEVETQFSVRHLFNNDYEFRPNIVADNNDALGGEAVYRFHRGLDPNGFRYGAELYGHGSTGSFDFGRAALTLRLGIPLPGRFDMATEYAAGTSVDSLPIQHYWYVGGSGTLRGYHTAALTGPSFWRARGELGYGLPAVRLVAFSDVAWAGRRQDFQNSRPLLSVGAGMSVLDGILRFDVARGLREPKGWAATLYFDAAL
ncbi:MAG TPA: BamA/TamA family outer membrane protein, partial [Longimicrobiales bacterium]|nr:BamA/TamA family outer membrane protein [Longimicrobiales bacterium]